MNHDAKMQQLQGIFDRCLAIAHSKGHDYSGEEDAMSNFKDFGWQGIIVRLGDKYHRVKNFAKTNSLSVRTESIEDTLLDLINYAGLALIQLREEKIEQMELPPYRDPEQVRTLFRETGEKLLKTASAFLPDTMRDAIKEENRG